VLLALGIQNAKRVLDTCQMSGSTISLPFLIYRKIFEEKLGNIKYVFWFSIQICLKQFNENKVMHFLFNLLGIKGLYMFRALFVHPQEALHKLHLTYCVRIMSVDCVSIAMKLQPWHSQLTLRMQYTKCRFCSASWGWASNVRNM
jgi:hypothetical protein